MQPKAARDSEKNLSADTLLYLTPETYFANVSAILKCLLSLLVTIICRQQQMVTAHVRHMSVASCQFTFHSSLYKLVLI